MECIEDKEWIIEIEGSIEELVVDYFELALQRFSRVKWKSVGSWNEENCKALVKLLNNRTIIFSGEEDSLLWCVRKYGEYKVNVGYSIQRRR